MPTQQDILLRNSIFELLRALSKKYTRRRMKEEVFVDVDSNGNIIGLDLTVLFGLNINVCHGQPIALKYIKPSEWKVMKINRFDPK